MKTRRVKPALTETEKALKAAREHANQYPMLSPEWENAMKAVYALGRQANDEAPKFTYTSIDGDIFA